jgi:hypothetical protein
MEVYSDGSLRHAMTYIIIFSNFEIMKIYTNINQSTTGMEDYYDSSFYFHAGIFQLPVRYVFQIRSRQTTIRSGSLTLISVSIYQIHLSVNLSQRVKIYRSV